jgi:hypothetical protein
MSLTSASPYAMQGESSKKMVYLKMRRAADAKLLLLQDIVNIMCSVGAISS